MSRFRSINSNNILYSDASMSPGFAVTAAADRVTIIHHSYKSSIYQTGAGIFLNSSCVKLRHYYFRSWAAPVFKRILSKYINDTGFNIIGSSSAMQEGTVIYGAAAAVAPRPGFDCLLTSPNPVFNHTTTIFSHGQPCKAEAETAYMCTGRPAFFSNILVDSTRKDGIADTITPKNKAYSSWTPTPREFSEKPIIRVRAMRLTASRPFMTFPIPLYSPLGIPLRRAKSTTEGYVVFNESLGATVGGLNFGKSIRNTISHLIVAPIFFRVVTVGGIPMGVTVRFRNSGKVAFYLEDRTVTPIFSLFHTSDYFQFLKLHNTLSGGRKTVRFSDSGHTLGDLRRFFLYEFNYQRFKRIRVLRPRMAGSYEHTDNLAGAAFFNMFDVVINGGHTG